MRKKTIKISIVLIDFYKKKEIVIHAKIELYIKLRYEKKVLKIFNQWFLTCFDSCLTFEIKTDKFGIKTDKFGIKTDTKNGLLRMNLKNVYTF